MQNKNILWGIGGLLVGVLIVSSMSFMNHHRDGDRDRKMKGSQEMTMSEMMTHMNANLQGKTGDAFDKVFIQDMILHHQGAIDMANLASVNANHSEIKTLAKAIITAQTKEIDQMKTWYKTWYGVDLNSVPSNDASMTVSPVHGTSH